MLSFYRRPDWPRALRPFANVDEDAAAVATPIGEAVRELASTKPAGTLDVI